MRIPLAKKGSSEADAACQFPTLLPLRAEVEVTGTTTGGEVAQAGILAAKSHEADRAVLGSRGLTELEAFLMEGQQELLEANRDLEQLLRDRTRDLEAEHDKLMRAERLATLGLFASAIAHDLRNPLNTISLGIYWLRLRLADTDDELIPAHLQTIERELARSDRIIKTLLAFARTGEPERSPFDLNELIADVVQVIQPPPNVSVRTAPGEALPLLSADRAQLFQILENLVRNAIQAMPAGGVVTLSSECGDDRCRVRIADAGSGIPPEVQETIFEPLVTTKSSGTGLGLALCKRIVDAHKGRIWVENREEGGAVFIVDLPVDKPAPEESGTPAALEPEPEPEEAPV